MPLMQIYTDENETKIIEIVAKQYNESKIDALRRIIKAYNQ